MALIDSALLKIQGQYPSISNEALWEVYQFVSDEEGYSKLLAKLYPRDLVSSGITVKHNEESVSIVSLRDIKLYGSLIAMFNDKPILFVRNLPIRQWFVLDSVSSSKVIDEDSGIETWSYDFMLLDPITILKYIPLANNQLVSVPTNPPDDYELPANYLKFALGNGTEVKESIILQNMIDHTLYNGRYLHPTTAATNNLLKFVGLKSTLVKAVPNPIYSPAKTSWINTECGELTTLEKMADMAYECPIIGIMDGNFPRYHVYDSPNLTPLAGVATRTMASYTAGFEHSDNQVVIGITETYPALVIPQFTNEGKTPYKRIAITTSEMPEGTSLTTAGDQLTSLVRARISKNDIKRFIDTQLTTQLKPWDAFILGDAIQLVVDDIQGFGVINLMVTEISEAIEDDAITYTLTLEELEDTYVS